MTQDLNEVNNQPVERRGWLINDFPVYLRKKVVAAACLDHITVPEYMERLLEGHFDTSKAS